MNVKNLLEIFTNSWQVLLPACIALITTTWALAKLYYHGRVENLKEQVNLLNIKNTFIEDKIRAIEEIKIKNPNNSNNADILEEKLSSLKYPIISDARKLSKADIRKLADFYDMTKSWKRNPHLKMKDGDISYWYEQNLSEEEIKLEFESRRIVLEEAEKNNQVIETQGDLSFFAQKIQSRLNK